MTTAQTNPAPAIQHSTACEPLDHAAVTIFAMLELRERTARESYDEIARDIRENDKAEVPGMSAEEREQAVAELRERSARWTEAQHALAEARALLDGSR